MTKKKPRVKAGTSKSAALARRKAFAKAYLANGRNATEAALAVGFSPRSAHVRGLELVKDRVTSALIEEAHAELSKITGLDMERTLREVARVSYSDTRKLYREDGTLKPPAEWDDDSAAAVAGVETLEEFDGRGEERKLIGYTKKLKIWDKNAALEKAMKFHGLYEKDNAQRAESLSLEVVLVSAKR